MEDLNENLLDAWLRLTTVLNNEKLVSDMPYNEALICNILYRNRRMNPERKLTATDLCRQTRMFKSQMNKTLINMERKHFIKRERSSLDKRNVYIIPNLEHSDVYKRQHKKILDIVDSIIEQLGEDKALELITLFAQVSDSPERIVK